MSKENDGKKNVVERMRTLSEFSWNLEPESLSPLKRFGLQLYRFVSIVMKGFSGKRCALHAAGLTYFSILSVVPVLLLMLLLTKPCGMYEWAREKLRVQTDQMIETFFEAQGAVPAPAATGSEKPGAADAASVRSEAPGAGEKPAAQPSGPNTKDQAGEEFGAQARQLRDQILGQIDAKIQEFNFGLMAVVGFLVLSWTVIKTFGQVEASLNEIWDVKRNRPLWRKFLVYVSAVMVLPLLTALAMSLPLLRVAKGVLDATLGSTSYTKWAGDALVSVLDSSLFSFSVSLLFSGLAIAFVFKAMPNRKVDTRAAFEGGFVTAVLLGVWVRLCAVLQFGISNSSAAYGSFALIPILIVWLNMSWTILLLGSNMSYAFQCIHRRVRSLSGE